jgi:hypothetical protein
VHCRYFFYSGGIIEGERGSVMGNIKVMFDAVPRYAVIR